MNSISVLIKPVSGSCNMNCDYCFYKDIADHRCVPDLGKMTADNLELIVQRVFDSAEQSASFSFQGGEPSLRGLDFYYKFIELQKKYNIKGIHVTNCFQTNGLLINDEWADFFAENNFLVGLSLDGYREIHNQYRHRINGEETYSAIMHTANILKRKSVDFNILFTVTSLTAKHPGKVYSFFRKNGFDFLQFMPCIDPREDDRGKSSFSLKPQEYAFFLKRFFDRWSDDILSGSSVSVRYFDNLVSMAAGLPPEACSLRGRCSCQFIFEADGSCYPCDFYVNEKWKLGNIKNMLLEDIYASQTCKDFLNFGKEINNKCKGCKWFFVCRGGCRVDRENPERLNYYCTSYKSFFEYAWPKIVKTAKFLVYRNSAHREQMLDNLR